MVSSTAWLALIVSVIVLGEAQSRIAAQLRAAADIDPLTRVANRRAWETQTARHLTHAQRTGEPLSIAIVDLDDFKAVNDGQGHAAGDVLVRELSDGWSRRLRGTDLLGRYGGDEFVVCLPGTDRAGTGKVLQQLADAHPFSWSVGVAEAADGDTVDSLVSRADADLYEHKRTRRGR
jgi:diguanylate cyclase (GGDEF)-like protein